MAYPKHLCQNKCGIDVSSYLFIIISLKHVSNLWSFWGLSPRNILPSQELLSFVCCIGSSQRPSGHSLFYLGLPGIVNMLFFFSRNLPCMSRMDHHNRTILGKERSHMNEEPQPNRLSIYNL